MKRGRIKIEDADDLNDIMSDMFHEFLETFAGRRDLLIPVDELTEDDDFYWEEGWSFVYTQKGQDLAERYLNRLNKVFKKYFDEDDFYVTSYLFQS